VPEEVKANCTVVDRLTDFFKDPRPAPNIEAGYAFARLHNWDVCVDEYVGLYKRLVE
jgi:hypothetical protein